MDFRSAGEMEAVPPRFGDAPDEFPAAFRLQTETLSDIPLDVRQCHAAEPLIDERSCSRQVPLVDFLPRLQDGGARSPVGQMDGQEHLPAGKPDQLQPVKHGLRKCRA
ncbi:MAG: hypothetical protein MZV64_02670 [Ignavibacteriales bacterium]|nr:hypothetical protein [Ignavibacteriales bacterium]